jgi:hypothetical protein
MNCHKSTRRRCSYGTAGEIRKTGNNYWVQIYSTFVFSKFRVFVIIFSGFWHLVFGI